MNNNGHQRPATIPTSDDARQDASCDFSRLLKRPRGGIQKRDLRKRDGRRDRDWQKHSVDSVEWHVVAVLLDRVVPE